MSAKSHNPEPASTFQPMALFSLLRKYRHIFLRYQGTLLLGVLALLLTNLLGIAIPWQIKNAVDTLQQIFSQSHGAAHSAQWQDFMRILWLIAGLAVAVLISRVASRIFLLGVGRRVEADLRNVLYGHLLTLPPDYYAAHSPGELMSRMTNDVDATKFLTGGGIMLGVNTFLAYATAIPMMLYINWPLALVTFLVYPVMIRVMTGISKKVRRGYYEIQEVLAELSTVAQENLNGMAVIQSYVREEQEGQRFEALCDKYFGTYTRLIHERILLFMVLAGLSGFSMLMVLLMGGWQVIAGKLDWGGFVAFTMYLEHLAWPTMALGWTISIFQQGTAALERIDSVLSTESNLKSDLSLRGGQRPTRQSSAEQAGEKQEIATGSAASRNGRSGLSSGSTSQFQGGLRIQNLTFAYRNPYLLEQDHSPILRNINLDIRPGETIALVGPVGSGKSTLLRLLPRLYDVPKNSIFLDGRDITELDPVLLREVMVFMPQLSFLFSTTVRQNIAFGQPDALRNEEALIIPAAETAAVHADIERLPARYETLVGERGLMLSGGQRQRVALARAILMDAQLLVLDDPFSNVDAETERAIVDALRERRIFHNKTTLLATHRFSLISLCDRVALMDGGRLIAVGTSDELLATQPLYQKLYRLQELRSSLAAWELDAAAEAEIS